MRVGVSSHLTLCMPSPSTISIRSARLLYTITSRACPVSVTRTLIFSGSIGNTLLGPRNYRSELDRRPLPAAVSRPGASDRLRGPAPALAGVAPRAAPPDVQQSLALRVEVEKPEHVAALQRARRVLAADELVVRHAAVGQSHGSPCLDPYPRAQRQARSEHQRVQQVAFESQVNRHGAVVERAGQRRDEVDMPGGPALEKAAPRNLDHHLDLRRFGRCLRGPAVLRVLHRAG